MNWEERKWEKYPESEACSPELMILQRCLGASLAPSGYQESAWQQEAGPTVFSPFPETSDYFGIPTRSGC